MLQCFCSERGIKKQEGCCCGRGIDLHCVFFALHSSNSDCRHESKAVGNWLMLALSVGAMRAVPG